MQHHQNYHNMDPMTIALLMGGIKGGAGLMQMIAGGKYAKTQRPTYEIPQAATQALILAQQLATQRELPGQSIMEDKIGATTAGYVGAAKEVADSPAAILGGLSKAYTSEADQLSQLGQKASEFYVQNQMNLQNQLGDMAKYQQMAWDYNKNQPYQNAMATASGLQGAGMQNIMSGAGDALGGAFYSGMQDEMLTRMGYPKIPKTKSNEVTKPAQTGMTPDVLQAIQFMMGKAGMMPKKGGYIDSIEGMPKYPNTLTGDLNNRIFTT